LTFIMHRWHCLR